MKGRVDVEVHLVEGVLTEFGIPPDKGAELWEEIFGSLFPFFLRAGDAVLRGGIFTECGRDIHSVQEYSKFGVIVDFGEPRFVFVEHRRGEPHLRRFLVAGDEELSGPGGVHRHEHVRDDAATAIDRPSRHCLVGGRGVNLDAVSVVHLSVGVALVDVVLIIL